MGEETKKKLCLVVPDLNKGGMERVMSELAWYFSTRPGIETHIVLLTSRSKIFYTIPEEINIHEPGFEFNNKCRLISTLRTLFFVRKKVKFISPIAVLSFGETYNSFVLLATLLLGLRVFVSDRSKPDKRWGLFHEYLRKALYPFAAGIVSQTNYSKEFLTKVTGHKNIRVIPNPVRKIENRVVEKKNVILNIGRLFKSKRIDLLLDIFSKSETENWELWIVGEGDQEEDLINQASLLNISEKVKFWGKQSDVNQFYSVAKIFAFTSESEGLPNALLEALAAGVACISFDCIAGPRDLIIDGENGFLVKMYDCQDFISKLNMLIQSEEVREKFSQNARKKAEEFNINIIGEKFYNFLLS